MGSQGAAITRLTILGYGIGDDGQDQSPDMPQTMKPLPIQWSELAEEETRRIQECFVAPSMFLDMVRYNNSLVMPRLFAGKLAERIYNFALREDDIWVLSYPKTGTTWTTELVWM